METRTDEAWRRMPAHRAHRADRRGLQVDPSGVACHGGQQLLRQSARPCSRRVARVAIPEMGGPQRFRADDPGIRSTGGRPSCRTSFRSGAGGPPAVSDPAPRRSKVRHDALGARRQPDEHLKSKKLSSSAMAIDPEGVQEIIARRDSPR
ncbi:MAG: hypothetical protein MZV70_03655 [Desulfobacterales bacterium]|nr:hypothetical protein [Desulfobacterales bacterium]